MHEMRFRRRDRKNGLIASEQALLDAHRAQERVAKREPEVRAVAKTLKEIRERNHFAENLRTIMERG